MLNVPMPTATRQADGRPNASQLVPIGDLAGLLEIAEAFGVAVPTIHSWRRRYPTFPQPVVVLHATPVWRLSEIRAWMMVQPRRPGRPRKTLPVEPLAAALVTFGICCHILGRALTGGGGPA